MNINKTLACCAATLTLLNASAALADTLVVQDGIIFSTGTDVLNVAAATGATLPTACVTPIAVTRATSASEVVVSGNSAFVKTGEEVHEVDISQCLPEVTHDVDDCLATVDLASGNLVIPCLYYNDKVYTINMDQRGNSMNWEVSFTGENGDFLDYRRGENANQ